MSDPTTRPDHCRNCGNWLSAIEQRRISRMCNECLDVPANEEPTPYDGDDMAADAYDTHRTRELEAAMLGRRNP